MQNGAADSSVKEPLLDEGQVESFSEKAEYGEVHGSINSDTQLKRHQGPPDGQENNGHVGGREDARASSVSSIVESVVDIEQGTGKKEDEQEQKPK